MGKPILADGTDRTAPMTPLQRSERVAGTVYVIDLIGFSQITEAEIAQSARSGTETVTRMVTDLFGTLMSELALRNIHFGGFAGDALIAWQAGMEDALPALELETLAADICDHVAPGLSCRTATARGTFWTSDLKIGETARPLVWGPCVSAAFAALASKPRPAAATNALSHQEPADGHSFMATASVTDRWAVIVRIMTSAECETTSPEQLSAHLQRTLEVSDAVTAEIDNIVQDDKGLLVIIALAASRAADTTQRDVLLDGLTIARSGGSTRQQTASSFGTIFRCQPRLAGNPITITIGEPINQAAKSLARARNEQETGPQIAPATKPQASSAVIGRDHDTRRLWQAYQASQHSRHTATLTAPAGIGKTTLVQTLMAQIDAPVASVEVTPGSQFAPFGCAQDLAEACGLSAATVFQPDGPSDLARRLPPVLVVENWHWCDEDSKRLIRRLHAEREAGLLLVTSRIPIDDLDVETRLNVTPFSFEQSRELMETLAPGRLSEPLQRSVFEIASGTPFWLVQAALHYSDLSGAKPLSAITGLEGLLAARRRSLSENATALWRLYCAWRLPLEFETARDLLAQFEIPIAPEHLDEIEALGWIIRDELSARDSYRPAHDILADWGGSDLPLTFEQALHSAIARAVARETGSPSRIARHWQIAGHDLRAAIWFERAAQYADRAGAHSLTIAHLDQSERLSGAAETRKAVRDLEYLALSATANWGVGKLRRAKQTLIAFDASSKDVPNCAAKRAALSRAATIQSEVGQFAGNSSLILTGLFRGWRNRRDESGAYEVKARRQGFVYYTLGMLRLPVKGRLNELIDTAHGQGEYRSQTLLGCSAGTLYMTRGDWQEAESVLASCHAAIAQTDDRQMLGVAQCLLGLCYLFQGDADRAHDWFERVADTGRDQNHHMFKVWGAYAKAEARFYAGDVEQALGLALEARTSSKGLGDHQSACIIEGILAQLYLASGDDVRARTHARYAARFVAKLPPTNFSTLEGFAAPAHVGSELMRKHGADPELDAMIKTGRKALKSFAQVFKIAQPRRHFVDGLSARANGHSKSALKHFQNARSAAVALDMEYEQRLIQAALHALQETPDGAST
ncbi:MAG: tetratricopeptide repeat protein [Pseudomonadota bacterium]